MIFLKICCEQQTGSLVQRKIINEAYKVALRVERSGIGSIFEVVRSVFTMIKFQIDEPIIGHGMI